MVKVSCDSDLPEEGDYHVIINEAKDKSGDKSPAVDIEFEVLAGNPEGNEKKKLTEKFFLSGGSGKRLFALAEACGVITAEERKAFEQAKGGDFDESSLEGMQLCIGIRKNAKGYMETGFRLYHLESEDAKNIPKDADSLALIYGEGHGPNDAAPTAQAAPTAPTAPARQAAPAAPTAPATAAPATKPNPFAGIGRRKAG